MRISDWSSDVCSSDLRAKIVYAVDDTLSDSPEGLGLFRHLAKTAYRLETFLSLEEIGFTTDLRGIPVARAPLGELRQEVIDSGPEGSAARATAEAPRLEIGRAACRERVCQYL